MSIGEMLNVPARESVLFWVFIGLILAVIIIFCLRSFFLWYFKINELREEISKISKRLEGLNVQSGGRNVVMDQGTTTGTDDAEVAAAIAAAINLGR
jgi:hypothetical protein